MQAMQPVDIPIYDFSTHQRSGQTRRVEPADVVIIEGILVLHMPEACASYNSVASLMLCILCLHAMSCLYPNVQRIL